MSYEYKRYLDLVMEHIDIIYLDVIITLIVIGIFINITGYYDKPEK